MGMARVAKDLDDAVAQLKRDQREPVQTKVGDLTVEMRVVPGAASGERSAWDVFREIGPWAGDDGEQIAEMLAAERKDRPGSRKVGGF